MLMILLIRGFLSSQLSHYLNEYMEHSREVSLKARKHKVDTKTLKVMKDKAEKEAGEATIRADATMRRAEDAKAALRRAVKENSGLLGN